MTKDNFFRVYAVVRGPLRRRRHGDLLGLLGNVDFERQQRGSKSLA